MKGETNMKKNISLLLSAAFMITNVSAAEITKVTKEIETATATIEASGFDSGEQVSIRLLYPNITSVSDGKQTNTIAWLGEAIASTDGTVNIVLGMPNSTNGEIVDFNLEMIQEDGTKVPKMLKWIDSTGLAEVMLDIKQSATATEAFTLIKNTAESIDMSFLAPWDRFDPLTQKPKVEASIYAIRNDFTTFDDVMSAVNYHILQEELSSSVSKEDMLNTIETYKNIIDSTLFDDTYNNMKDNVEYDNVETEYETRLFNLRNKLDGSKEAFKYTFQEAVLAAHIAVLDRSAPLVPILNNFVDLLKYGASSDDIASIDKYVAANDDKKLEICGSILNLRATDIPSIRSVIAEAFSVPTSRPTPGGSNVGSNGGSSGGKVTSKIEIDIPKQTPSAETSPFSDVKTTHYAFEGIKYLKDNGIIHGYVENGIALFKPDNEMTREEFVKTIVSAFGYEINDLETDFVDVDENAWYAPFVISATNNGIVYGVGENRFGVGEKITREQMCTIIYRVAMIKNIDLYGNNTTIFADDEEISDYAKEAVTALKKAGIISGDTHGHFNPNENATRANVARVLYGILSK